ncbi:MAG TPA: DUF1778 domain-containing protein [Rhodanobacteraceae bacterium]|nr:DUF1778 domain-containing protein [Rhodanobacteraceae bacterium]
MTAAARLDLRLSPADKARIHRAADLRGVPVSAFVRDAVLREAETVIARPRRGSLAARLRGRATAGMSTDEIMQLTRDA